MLRIFLISMMGMLGLTTIASGVEEVRRFGDWQTSCEAGRCVARTVAEDRNAIEITRERNTIHAEWILTLHMSPEPPKDAGLRFVIDGRRTMMASDGIVSIDGWLAGYGNLVPELRRGRRLRLTITPGDRQSIFSLVGMEAALLWIDVQETNAREEPKREDMPGTIGAFVAAQPDCGGEGTEPPSATEAAKLDAKRTLYIVACSTRSEPRGRSFMLFIRTEGDEGWSPLALPFHIEGYGWFAERLLTNVAFDRLARTLTAGSAGECKVSATWRWVNESFRLENTPSASGCWRRLPAVRPVPAGTQTTDQPLAEASPHVRDRLLPIVATDPDCNASDATLTNESIDPDRTLHMITCNIGMYNGAYLLVLEDRSAAVGARWRPLDFAFYHDDAGGTASRMLVDATYESATRKLTHRRKARGMGDCGEEAEWRWTGRHFSLRMVKVKVECDGRFDEWPTIFKAH